MRKSSASLPVCLFRSWKVSCCRLKFGGWQVARCRRRHVSENMCTYSFSRLSQAPLLLASCNKVFAFFGGVLDFVFTSFHFPPLFLCACCDGISPGLHSAAAFVHLSSSCKATVSSLGRVSSQCATPCFCMLASASFLLYFYVIHPLFLFVIFIVVFSSSFH